MGAYICVTCGTQYPPSGDPPMGCPICLDERQYVGWDGQQWTTLAELHYREAIRLWPGYGEAHNNLAILLQQRGELTEAEEHYRAALEARPEDPEAHYNYALLLRTAGRGEDAERHFRTAHDLAPDVPTFQSGLERAD